MPSKLSERLMSAYMGGTPEDIEAVKAEIAAEQQSRLTPKKENVLKINTVLNDEKSSAIRVYNFMNQAFGEEWDTWEIETIEKSLWIHYGVALEDINRDKLLAIRHLCNSDGAFWDWFEFNQLCLAFSGAIADFECLRAPSPGMVINTVKAMNYIRPDRNSFFGDEVLKYICVLLNNEGLYISPPSILFIINDEMKKIVSSETQAKWIDILKRYNELLSGAEAEENEIDIQARRLVVAEAAALTYSE